MSEEMKKRIDELKRELGRLPKDTRSLEVQIGSFRENADRLAPESILEFISLLEAEAVKLEADHPSVTALIDRVATSLSNLGI